MENDQIGLKKIAIADAFRAGRRAARLHRPELQWNFPPEYAGLGWLIVVWERAFASAYYLELAEKEF